MTKRNGRVSIEVGQLFDRLPPNKQDAERALLGSLIIGDGSHWCDSALMLVEADDFYQPKHAEIFAVLKELHQPGEKCDLLLLMSTMQSRGTLEDVGGEQYLVQLAESVPVASHAPHYAKVVAECAMQRRVIEAAARAMQAAYTSEQTSAELIDSLATDLSRLSLKTSRKPARAQEAMLARVNQCIEREHGHTGVETGLLDLDRLISPMQPGDMVVVAARPGVGKSMFALHVAEHNARRGVPSLVVNYEMSLEQIADRLIVRTSRVPTQRFARYAPDATDASRIARAPGDFGDLPLFLYDADGLTITAAESISTQYVARHGVGLVVIDYLQRMVTGKDHSSRQEEVSEMSRRIKTLAKVLRVPIVCLAQLNRQVEARKDGVPTMADIRDSGAVEQDADIIAFIHRDRPKFGEVSYEAAMIVAKNRNGPPGAVRLHWDDEKMMIANAAAPPPKSPRASQQSLEGVPI